ncbi:hypothetical protein M569_04830 [Genlisea aurea]|uniref:Uncharacterized protein n=1 Tax=Genlisea aurea TaxID=192259 RepID=S8E2Q0_9LAMI|nr:hypothetical protein M569_04830 [Genlisea aurea]
MQAQLRSRHVDPIDSLQNPPPPSKNEAAATPLGVKSRDAKPTHFSSSYSYEAI